MTESYTISIDFINGVNIGQLFDEILNSSISTNLLTINRDDDDLNIDFSSIITAGEKTILDNIITSHSIVEQFKTTADPISNLESTTNPTTNDDISLGYGPGSIWINKNTSNIFTCVDGTLNNAVWKENSQSKIVNLPFRFKVQHTRYMVIGEFIWSPTFNNNNGVLTFYSIYTDRELDIRIWDVINNALLGANSFTTNGIQNIPFTNPLSDTIIQVQARKDLPNGTDPEIRALEIKWLS